MESTIVGFFLIFSGGILALIAPLALFFKFYLCDEFGHENNNSSQSQHSESEEMYLGPIADRAGVFGIFSYERMLLLRHLFAKHTYILNVDGNLVPFVSNEAGELSVSENNDIQEGTVGDNPDLQTTKVEVDSDEENQQYTQMEGTCCICLADYEPGCQVLFSTTCKHHFHAECAFQWLRKRDNCPCCREEMYTAKEVRDSAFYILRKKGKNYFTEADMHHAVENREGTESLQGSDSYSDTSTTANDDIES